MSEEKKSSSNDIDENKVMGIISYIGPLCLIPILVSKDSKFAMFHAKQGLVLLIAWVIVGVFSSIPILGWFFGPILMLVVGLVSILGLVMALQGKEYRIPVVANMADKFKL